MDVIYKADARIQLFATIWEITFFGSNRLLVIYYEEGKKMAKEKYGKRLDEVNGGLLEIRVTWNLLTTNNYRANIFRND